MSSLFFTSGNAPDAKVILNRNTQFQYDITNDIIDIGTNNSVGDIFGSFTVVLDNTNDKHVDRFGNVDIATMSSIEIFVKSAVANQNEIPSALNGNSITTEQNQSIGSIIDNIYGITTVPVNAGDEALKNKNKYIKQFANLNYGQTVNFVPPLSSIKIDNKTNIGAYADYELAPGQNFKMPPLHTDYKRIFLGVVLNVQQAFSAGSNMTITLTGESLGYWLKSSVVNIAPSLSNTANFVSTSTSPVFYSNKYDDTSALDIFSDLIKYSSNDTLTIADFNFGSNGTSYEYLNNSSYLQQNIYDELGQPYVEKSTDQPLTLQQAFANANPSITVDDTATSVLIGLDPLQTSINNGTLLDGTKVSELDASSADPITAQNIIEVQNKTNAYTAATINYNNVYEQSNLDIELQKQIIQINPGNQSIIQKANTQINNDINKIQDAQNKMDLAQADVQTSGIIKSQTNAISVIRDNIQTNMNSSGKSGVKILQQLGIINHWKQIFGQIILEVVDASFLQRTFPFKEILQAPDYLDGDYQPKSTIAKQVADALNFEFYVDTNGHFVLKPPMYNIGIPNDDPTYIIKQEDITSWNINDNVEGIITRVGVTGDWHTPAQLERAQTYNIHTDLNLINKYGVHDVELNNQIFLKDVAACASYGQSYMAQNNQKLRSASVTILGRPDLRLGVACYLKPRDTVYYIEAISHNFSIASQYTTTLTLVGARKIVCGYEVQSKIEKVTTSNINGINIRSTTDTNSGFITHWNLANSLSQPILSTISNPNNQSPQTQAFYIARNTYIITSHPNIAYIGLIVPQGSAILNDINYNIFRYLYTSVNITTQGSITNPSLQTLQTQFGKNTKPFDYILNAMLTFIFSNKKGIDAVGKNNYPATIPALKNSLDSATNPKNSGAPKNPEQDSAIALFNAIALSFTQDVLDDFTSNFLNLASGNILTANQTKNTNDITNWSNASDYFNEMISSISDAGSYKPYTDSDGREYPVLLDYGRSFVIAESQITMNTNSPAQQASNTQNKTNAQVDAIISAARQYLLAGNPNVSQPNNPNSSK